MSRMAPQLRHTPVEASPYLCRAVAVCGLEFSVVEGLRPVKLGHAAGVRAALQHHHNSLLKENAVSQVQHCRNARGRGGGEKREGGGGRQHSSALQGLQAAQQTNTRLASKLVNTSAAMSFACTGRRA